MADQTNPTDRSDVTACPKAPNPCADTGLEEQEKGSLQGQSEAILVVRDENWDLKGTSATSCIKLLINAVQSLAEVTGDVPPTPPASRPTTPGGKAFASSRDGPSPDPKSPMSPVSPVSPASNNGTAIVPVTMPSPEAHRDEPLPVVVGGDAESVALQQLAISRRFFLKTVPPFTLSQYLMRLHHYCPHSPGVYLTAASYVQRLCVAEVVVPATNKTIHRLCLAAIRVASKALEDHKWAQERVAKVGGVSRKELRSLEINLCFLLDFDLFVREGELKRRVFSLQQAATQGHVIKKRLSGGIRASISLPFRNMATDVG